MTGHPATFDLIALWGGDLSVLIGLVFLQIAYLVGVTRFRTRYALAPEFPKGQALTFTFGVVTIYFALQSPLHTLSERYLFSAHMFQHLLLTDLAVPLLMLGTPSWLIRPLMRYPAFARPLRFLTQPVFAFLVFNGALAFSHLPPVYDLALQVHSVHILQHLVYLSTAVLMWWSICGPLPEVNRLPYPGQLIYLFAQTLPAFAVGAMLTFAPNAVYPTYAAAPRIFDLSAIDDQRVGGLTMWVIGSVYYLIVLGAVFFTWFEREEARSRREMLARQAQ